MSLFCILTFFFSFSYLLQNILYEYFVMIIHFPAQEHANASNFGLNRLFCFSVTVPTNARRNCCLLKMEENYLCIIVLSGYDFISSMMGRAFGRYFTFLSLTF